jgi:hypothetical protein
VRLSIEVGSKVPPLKRSGLDVAGIGNPQLGFSAALGVPFWRAARTGVKERRVIPAIKNCADEITSVLGVSRREPTCA